jgi:hypothetical protein
VEIITTPRPLLSPPRNRYVYYPGAAEVPESQAVKLRNRSYIVTALVDIPEPGPEGVLFAHGSRFGGHALYIKDNRLRYVYNFVGSFEQRVVATRDVPTGENLVLSANFEKDGEDPPGVSTGILSLYHGDDKVGEGRIKTQPGKFLPRRGGSVRRTRQRRTGHRRLPRHPALALHRRHDAPCRRRRQRRAVRRAGTRGRRDSARQPPLGSCPDGRHWDRGAPTRLDRCWWIGVANGTIAVMCVLIVYDGTAAPDASWRRHRRTTLGSCSALPLGGRRRR